MPVNTSSQSLFCTEPFLLSPMFAQVNHDDRSTVRIVLSYLSGQQLRQRMTCPSD
jgi:hypothetical protein